jgi:predicted metal-binding membrane protein
VTVLAGVIPAHPVIIKGISGCPHCKCELSHGGFQGAATGSLMLGFRHGVYCLGCCWALMILLFALGVMNLFWIATLAVLVLLEKVIPLGRVIARIAGIVSFAGGLWMLFQPS